MSHNPDPGVETRQGMFCYFCGQYTVKRRELHDHIGVFACENGDLHFTRTVYPLFIVTGASGVGKSAIIEPLQRLLTGYGVFDKDQMWACNWDMTYNNYFRVASTLAQGGIHTVIVGTIIPEHLTGLSDRDLVGQIYYLNLHTDDDTRRTRLLNRRKWDRPDEAFIQTHARFAAWLVENAGQGFGQLMPVIDTTHQSPQEVAEQVAEWVKTISISTEHP